MRTTKAHRRDREARSSLVRQACDAIEHHGRRLRSGLASKRFFRKLLDSKGKHLVAFGRKKFVPYGVMLRIAFTPLARRNDAARAQGVSPKWATTLRNAVARGCLVSQARALDQLEGQFAECPCKKIFATSLAFDETTETLCLPLHNHLFRAIQQSAWHVCVSQQEFLWSIEELTGKFKTAHWDALRPSVPLLGTDAETVFDGLFNLPSVAPFVKCAAASATAATISMVHFDRDGASSNDRVVAAMVKAHPTGLVSHATCGNHNNSLAEGSVVASVGAEILPKLYSLSCLLRMGGHFVRLLHTTVDLIEKHMPRPRRQAAAPPGSQAYIEELLSYALDNYKRFHDDNDELYDRGLGRPWRRGEVRHREYAKACADFGSFFSWVSGQLVHVCPGEECCSSLGRYKQRAQTVIISLVYRCLPSVPTKSKWTKTGPCLDFHMLSQGFDLLQKQLPMAFDPKGVTVTVHKGYQDPEEIGWHRMVGIRSQKARELVADPLTFYKVTILSIVLEPLRFLTRWFMVEGSKKRRDRRQRSGMPPRALRPTVRPLLPGGCSVAILRGHGVRQRAECSSPSHPVLEGGLRRFRFLGCSTPTASGGPPSVRTVCG